MRLPLDDVRVADFTWIGAGSYATKTLADFGADVIKIETATRPDSLRLVPPFKDKQKGINRSGYFADRNAGKRSLALNMKHPGAREVAVKLITRSDVVINNFTPGVMEQFRLGYDDIVKFKPDVIYVAMSMLGADGPEHKYLGYGQMVNALSGLLHLTGLPDREPAGTGTNYPDHIPNPCHAVFALLAALRHKRRTGQGQCIDMSQLEAPVALLGPTVLDCTANGVDSQRNGNQHPEFALHGVYPCAGEDRWIAIAARTEEQWRTLAREIGADEWLRDARWRDGAARQRHRVALDALIAGVTAKRTGEELMQRLQAAGVAAGVVQTAADVLARDPQLAHRGHWVKLSHPEMGETIYNAPPVLMSRTPARLRSAAPLLGQHTREVCREVLELSDATIDRLVEEGVLR